MLNAKEAKVISMLDTKKAVGCQRGECDYAKKANVESGREMVYHQRMILAQDHRQGTRFRSRREGEMPKAYVVLCMMSE